MISQLTACSTVSEARASLWWFIWRHCQYLDVQRIQGELTLGESAFGLKRQNFVENVRHQELSALRTAFQNTEKKVY